MNNRFLYHFVSGLLVLVVALCLPLSAQADRPDLTSTQITGAAPNINGTTDDGEWPGAPQIVFDANTPPTAGITYVIPTYVYFCNDLTNLYVMVDVVGDTTIDSNDECLLIFGSGAQFFVPEGFGSQNVSGCTPQGITFATGFGVSPNSEIVHRIFEWRIPLSVIAANPGQKIDFCSPHYWKFQCPILEGSLGYDASTGYDNVWPPGLVGVDNPQDRSNWGILQLQPTQQQSIPTLNEWGMILMGLLLAGGAVWTMKRRSSVSM